MQSPPRKQITIDMKFAKTLFRDAVNKRAKALCKDRIGWYGEQGVIYALWLKAAALLDAQTDEELEDAVNFYLNPDDE